MCPDKELISAYHDGETDGKWKFDIKRHLGSCEKCESELLKLDGISKFLGAASVPDEEQIKLRVYSALKRKQNVIYPEPFWKRHFEISFPVIISAAAVLCVLCTVMFIGFQIFSQQPEVVEEIMDEPEFTLQVLSLEDAAAYLLSDDSGFDVLITIPSSDALSFTGEPRLIREADYKRGQ